MAKVQIETSWQEKLQQEFDEPYFEELIEFLGIDNSDIDEMDETGDDSGEEE